MNDQNLDPMEPVPGAEKKPAGAKRGRKPSPKTLVASSIKLDAETDFELRALYEARCLKKRNGKADEPFGRWLAKVALAGLKGGLDTDKLPETLKRERREAVREMVNPFSAASRSALAEAAATRRMEGACARGAFAAHEKLLKGLPEELGAQIGGVGHDVAALHDEIEMLRHEVAGLKESFLAVFGGAV